MGKKTNWEFLSYILDESSPMYGNGEGFRIDKVSRIEEGKASNNSALRLPAHVGTHIDFPLHFLADGKKGTDYPAGFWIFNEIRQLDISTAAITDFLIKPEHFGDGKTDEKADALIVYTGFSRIRHEEAYWKENWGFHPDCAGYIRNRFPNVRVLIFDLISLSSYQQREIGREAHRVFLQEPAILPVEDASLSLLTTGVEIESLVISPLRYAGADGTPVTILAEFSYL